MKQYFCHKGIFFSVSLLKKKENGFCLALYFRYRELWWLLAEVLTFEKALGDGISYTREFFFY